MIKNTEYILLLLLIMVMPCIAQENRKEFSQDDIIIKGELIDSTILLEPSKKQKLAIHTSTFASNFTTAPKTITNQFTIGYKEPFKMVLHPRGDFIYINFSLSRVGREVRRWSGLDNTYILERGDVIHCKLSNKSYEFSGKGSEKLNCQNEIYRLKYKMTESENQLLLKKKYEEYFFNVEKRMDGILKLQLKVVKKYEQKLGKKMTDIMIANCYGLRYFDRLRGYYISSYLSPETKEAFIAYARSDAFKNIDLQLKHNLDTVALIASPTYSDFLFQKIRIENLVNSDGEILARKPELSPKILNAINTKYNGLLREKLLVMFCIQYPDAINYLDNLAQYFKSEEYRNILTNLKSTRAIGTAFFPFELQDAEGKIVKLSDLNKKIVILDFWYTGCENCILVHEGLRSVIDKYNNNSNIEFVSISIDKDKNQWLKSVAGEKYTDASSINLYTNGLGSKHPVIENNNIQSYPTLYILKHGRIFSASPPRPGPSLTNESSIRERAEFILLIEDALMNDRM